MNDIEKAIKRIRILMRDDCNCEECMKSKEAYKIILDTLEKQKQQIQDLENTIDRILDEQTEREKYTHELEEKVKEHRILTNTAKETNRQIIFKED